MSPQARFRVTPRAAILILMALTIIGLSIEPAREAWRTRQESIELTRRLAAEKSESGSLSNEVARLDTDAYIEQQARQRLGLIKAGEEAFVIVPPKQEKPAPQQADAKPATPKPQPKPKAPEPSWWDRAVKFVQGLWD